MRKFLIALSVMALPGACVTTAPAFADRVEVQCQPLIRPTIKCDPAALRYNRAPLACHTA